MKHIIILGDGMADWSVKSLGDKTLLQYAKTPYMDKLARMGRNGRLITVAEGFHPGSEVANMSVLGYNLPKVYEGRGPLEAASIGVDLQPGEMAMRCNLICVEGEILKNHSSGHISTEEADVLIQYLQEKLGNDRVRFHLFVISFFNAVSYVFSFASSCFRRVSPAVSCGNSVSASTVPAPRFTCGIIVSAIFIPHFDFSILWGKTSLLQDGRLVSSHGSTFMGLFVSL